MEIMQIGADTYKTKIDAAELHNRGLSYAMLDGSRESTLRLLEDVLHQIAERYGKNYMLDQMLAEFFPDADGGCCLYFSREQSLPAAKEEKIPCACFASRRDLLLFWKAMQGRGQTPVYQLWEQYYLCLPKQLAMTAPLVGEFAQVKPLSMPELALLMEYAKEVHLWEEDEKTQT